MSLSALTGAPATQPPSISFHPHGHKRGVHNDSSTGSDSATSGQNPATTQGLFSSLLSTLAQVAVGANPIASVLSALTPAAPATGTASTAGTSTAATTAASAQTSGTPQTTASSPSDATQSFLHSLFTALKADGLEATGALDSAGATATGAGSGTAGRYERSLTSSLQTLIQQLGSNGTATANPATVNLSASFNNLMQSVNRVSATGGSAAGGSSTASNQSLTAFLNNLLQTVQNDGGHALSALGGNFNAKV